jgi:RND family efflux transporter MFP subunit
MSVSRKVAALAVGATLALSAATITTTRAQQPGGPSSGDSFQVEGTVEWVEKSEVAALIEGNLESLELDIGKEVKKGGTIGRLYSKKAELTLSKTKVAAESVGAIEKAQAQRRQALSVVARNDRMLRRDPLIVPKEDQEKAEAEVMVASAMIKEAEENQNLSRAELELAKNNVDEHTITAPFPGVIIKRLKNPGESVNAREPVVLMGNLDKLRVFAYIPLENLDRVSEGSVVEFEPMNGRRGGPASGERERFRGVISYIDKQIQPEVSPEIRIYADFKNENRRLLPGRKGSLTIYMNPPGRVASRPAPGPAAEAIPPTAVTGAPGVDLPALPR